MESSTLSRELVYDKIFSSFQYGNLGFFIGAGFSKALTKGEHNEALGWLDLIRKVSNNLQIDIPEDDKLIGVSLPEIATEICRKFSIEKDMLYEEAKYKLKKEISNVSNWLPTEEILIKYRGIFESLNPSWIITTNYDLVIESITTGKSKSLGPKNYLSSPKGIIPIYHLHGVRTDPESIVITQEDYIPLFRPNEYRQTKLAMTIRESTTLVLGYGLGDMNVLSALDWSKNLYIEKNEYPYEIIQALWVENPKEDPYIDKNGNIIIEINDIYSFLNSLIDHINEMNQAYMKELESLNQILEILETSEEENIHKFNSDSSFRIQLLQELSKFEYHMIYPYTQFLMKCMSDKWSKTSVTGNFSAYNTYLNIIMDIVMHYEFDKMPPRLFQIIAESLNRVLYYVGDESDKYHYGESWAASNTWHRRKAEFPKEMLIELLYYAQSNFLTSLLRKVRLIVSE